MEIEQNNVAMLPPGDFDKLSKHEREEFQTMQERLVQRLLQESNQFQSQFPGLRIEWRFQADVYKSIQEKASTIRYSGRVF